MKIFGNYIYIRKKTNMQTKKFVLSVPKNLHTENFAISDILSIFELIVSRLQNVKYSSKIEFLATKEIINFVKENEKAILINMFFKGYVIIDVKTLTIKNDFDYIYKANNEIEIKLKQNEIILFSETYKTTSKSDFEILKPKIDFLNTLNNADWSLIETYGALGIISPDGRDFDGNIITFDDDDRSEIQKDYQANYGLTAGKWKIIISKKPLKYSPIRLPISELELIDKRKNIILDLCTWLNFPKELHPLFENSKYANREQAEFDVYTNCIQKNATLMVNIIKKIYNERKKEERYLLNNEFWYDLNNVYSVQEVMYKEKERAILDLEFWQKVKISETEFTELANQRIKQLIESL